MSESAIPPNVMQMFIGAAQALRRSILWRQQTPTPMCV
jgi:hypothetical protein